MDFAIPADLQAYLDELDAFIAAEIKPLEQQDDNIRFFDHRREYARTDFEGGGLPRHEWEELLKEAKRRAVRELNDRLGPEADVMAMRIEACRSIDEFRERVRDPAWQHNFLAQPLLQREAIARDLRAQSEARKRSTGHDPSLWADVDADAARTWLQHANAHTLIHGHTHRPATHSLGEGLQRVVLSDWDAGAQPPRAEVLRLDAQGLRRIPLPPS